MQPNSSRPVTGIVLLFHFFYQQFWGYKVEEKLHLDVREQERLNTAVIHHRQHLSEPIHCLYRTVSDKYGIGHRKPPLFYWFLEHNSLLAPVYAMLLGSHEETLSTPGCIQSNRGRGQALQATVKVKVILSLFN
jgi:hypothetical protein